jgi:hypothetical protein
MAKKAKPLTGAERVKRHEERYRNAGLQQIKIWVHPDDAEYVRNCAANKQATSSILKGLREC